MISKYLFGFCAWTILFQPTALMAKTQVVASVDRSEMSLGDTLTYTIEIQFEGNLLISDPVLDFSNWEVVNQWENLGIKNGVRTQRLNYRLAAQKTGSLRIGPGRILIDGEDFEITGIEIHIGNNEANQPFGSTGHDPSDSLGAHSGPLESVEDLFYQLLDRKRQHDRPLPKNKPLNRYVDDSPESYFIHVETDKSEVYVGEQVVATWYLYTRHPIRDIDTLRYPNLKLFWKEDLEVATRLNFTSEIVNGQPYQSAVLVSYALFPMRAGEGIIDSYKAKCTVISVPNGLGGLGLFQPTVLVRQSKELKLKVLPLPVDQKPDDFSGAVGQFQLSMSAPSGVTQTGQPVLVKIRLEGMGNAKLAEFPKVKLPDGMKNYNTTTEARFFTNGQSYKEFQMSLIAAHSGEYIIAPIGLSVFNPETKKYERLLTAALNITVNSGGVALPLKGSQDPSADSDPTDPTDPKESTETVEPALPAIWTDAQIKSFPLSKSDLWSTFGLIGLIAGLMLGECVFWCVRLFLGRQRPRDLQFDLKKRFSLIMRLLRRKRNWRRAAIECVNTIQYVLGSFAREGGAGLRMEKLLEVIPPSIYSELGGELISSSQFFQQLGFGPESQPGFLINRRTLRARIKQLYKILLRAIHIYQRDESEI